MDLLKGIKKVQRDLGMSFFGNYYAKFEKLRNLRIITFFLLIFIVFINVYVYDKLIITKFSKHLYIMLVGLLLCFFALMGVLIYAKKRINKLKGNLNIETNQKVDIILQIIGRSFLVIGFISLIFFTLLSLIISFLFLSFIANKDLLNFFLSDIRFKIILNIFSFVIIFFIFRYLFLKEKTTRGFTENKLAINPFVREIYRLIYLFVNISSSLIEIALLYPLFFMDTPTNYIGCVLGKISLPKAQRKLKKYDFRTLFTIDSPRYINLFNGTKDIIFYGDFGTKTEIIYFGDYSLILNETSPSITKEIEDILEKYGKINIY